MVNERLARRADPRDFIQANLRIAPVPSLPEIRLYTAHPGSGLSRLLDADDAPPPYWAHHWAGGAVLARYVLDHPETVAGRRVLDLGAGSGVVGVAAAKAGAIEVVAADIDPYAIAALGLNAALNDVALAACGEDLTDGPPPPVDLILVGDLFYARDLAVRATAFLDRCLAAGIEVLIGDPGRSHLPHKRLRLLAERRVPDVDQVRDGTLALSGVFSLLPEDA